MSLLSFSCPQYTAWSTHDWLPFSFRLPPPPATFLLFPLLPPTLLPLQQQKRSSFFVRSTRVAKEKKLSLYYTVRKKFFGNSGVVSLGLISSPSFSFTRNLISLCNSRKKRSSLSPPIRYGSAVALVVLAEAAAAVVV